LKILKVTPFNKIPRLSRLMLKLSRFLHSSQSKESTSSEKAKKEKDNSSISVPSELENQRRKPSLSKTMVNILSSTTSIERRSLSERSSPWSQNKMNFNLKPKRSSLFDSWLKERSR